MKSLVVCVSVSHGNTRKVAKAIAGSIGAEVIDPGQRRPAEVTGYDLLGLGSGIYGMTFHPRLWRFAAGLPDGHGTPVFLFATSGGGRIWWQPASLLLTRMLRGKGYRVVDTFSCPGFDTWLPLRLVGGLNKGRPSAADLDAARRFGDQLRRHVAEPEARPAPSAPRERAPRAPRAPRRRPAPAATDRSRPAQPTSN